MILFGTIAAETADKFPIWVILKIGLLFKQKIYSKVVKIKKFIKN